MTSSSLLPPESLCPTGSEELIGLKQIFYTDMYLQHVEPPIKDTHKPLNKGFTTASFPERTTSLLPCLFCHGGGSQGHIAYILDSKMAAIRQGGACRVPPFCLRGGAAVSLKDGSIPSLSPYPPFGIFFFCKQCNPSIMDNYCWSQHAWQHSCRRTK